MQAATGSILGRDCALMQLYCLLGDCKAKANPASFAFARLIQPVKGTEQIGLSFGINTWPIISNYDADAAFG